MQHGILKNIFVLYEKRIIFTSMFSEGKVAMIVIFDCKEHRNSDYQIDRILLHSPEVNVFSKSCKVKTGIRLQMVT